MFSLNGWLVVIVLYGAAALILGALLYAVVRLAVAHALKAHTLWLETRRDPSA